MCAYLSKASTARFIKKVKDSGKSYFYGYKVLSYNNNAQHARYTYSAGRNEAEDYNCPYTGRSYAVPDDINNYDEYHPSGIHFYINDLKELKKQLDWVTKFTKVKVFLDDLIGVESKNKAQDKPRIQGVAKAVHITKRELFKKGR